jgi:hypothetical protein
MEMEKKEPVVKSLLVQMSKRMGNMKRNLFPLFYIQASPFLSGDLLVL